MPMPGKQVPLHGTRAGGVFAKDILRVCRCRHTVLEKARKLAGVHKCPPGVSWSVDEATKVIRALYFLRGLSLKERRKYG